MRFYAVSGQWTVVSNALQIWSIHPLIVRRGGVIICKDNAVDFLQGSWYPTLSAKNAERMGHPAG
jgi:hypothetical protein